jgi:hypothetical protein
MKSADVRTNQKVLRLGRSQSPHAHAA